MTLHQKTYMQVVDNVSIRPRKLELMKIAWDDDFSTLKSGWNLYNEEASSSWSGKKYKGVKIENGKLKLYQPTSTNNFVYSKAAAARMLGVPYGAIAGFQKWFKVCWVWVKSLSNSY